MNYSSSSPGNYGGPPGSSGPPGPGTPIMPSPQGIFIIDLMIFYITNIYLYFQTLLILVEIVCIQ